MKIRKGVVLTITTLLLLGALSACESRKENDLQENINVTKEGEKKKEKIQDDVIYEINKESNVSSIHHIKPLYNIKQL